MLANRGNHPIGVAQDIGVPEAHDFKAILPERFGTKTIPHRVGVLTTIHFNDQIAVATGKICHEWAHRMLPDELESHQLSVAQP
jgi:hypothetical protein